MKFRKKVVILGDGLLGNEIHNQTNWEVLSRKQTNFDIADLVKSFPKDVKIDVIINCIANTDTYSKDKKSHWDVNFAFVSDLIKYCNSNLIKLVHISTDYVYAQSIENASENDVPVHCNNWYGYTKLLADGLVQLEANQHLLIRCTHKPKPFPYEKAWEDQVGNFDYVNIIASKIIRLIKKNAIGIYNVGTETKTMFDLASKTSKVEPIKAPLHVPHNTSMDISKMQTFFNESVKKPFFSIAIPTYGYNGKGVEFIDHSLEILSKQTFKDFEVVISDHSIDDTIKTICNKWNDKLVIKYFRNKNGRGVISPNINNAMVNCTGKWIKILFQDDYLFGEESLAKHYSFIENNEDVIWFAVNTHVTSDGKTIDWSFRPKWVDNIWTGNNQLGCPTNITIKNENLLYFDEDLNWLMDVDYYMKMYRNFGPVKILDEFLLVNRVSPERLTNNLSESEKLSDLEKLTKRYA
jgi:dTDP-4-dehydrorhamnose reductase